MASSQPITTIQRGPQLIYAGKGLLSFVGSELSQNLTPKNSKYVVITDENINTHYGEIIQRDLKHTLGGKQLLVKVIQPGEESKCREVKASIEDWMIENRCTRDTTIIAIGGGVVGDLAGFVSATYMRGIPFVQVPTTVLAMVDSSIGGSSVSPDSDNGIPLGKTGIDVPGGKNLIGAFNQPKAIFLDTNFLATLNDRQYFNGYAEIIKTAAIRDASLFQLLEDNVEKLATKRDADLLLEVILRTATLKAEVVAEDPTEAGVRSILNFGHTVGHAIEAIYFPEMLHGECVSIGMVLETKLADFLNHLASSSIIGRLTRCLQAYKLPVQLPKGISFQTMVQKMFVDKKNANSQIRCTIIKSIGDAIPYPIPVEEPVWKQILLPFVAIRPGLVSGHILVPGSKSISNRALALCALAKGECRIKGLLHADDTHHMLDALDQLGLHLKWIDNGETLLIQGSEGKFDVPKKPVYLGNAGTASRFLTSICALMESETLSTLLTGSPRLKERPIKDLTDALTANGCSFSFVEKDGFFPFQVKATGIKGGDIVLSSKISSQFVSSILMAAPYAKTPVKLSLTGKTVSQPFIDMTTRLMEQFGIATTHNAETNQYDIPLGVYKNPEEFVIEADASSASYPLAMAAITGGKVTVSNVGGASLQGDAQFCTVLAKMGCNVVQTDTTTTVEGPKGLLEALDVDMGDMTDTFMTVAVLAAVADGTSRITGIANQRVKECNRIAAMVSEFKKVGIVSRELEDGLEIDGVAGDLSKVNSRAEIFCYNDHRIAMSFATLGCRVPGIIITDKDCVDKTFPAFWVAIRNQLSVQLEPANVDLGSSAPSKSHDLRPSPNRTIVLIGMRGSGKSTMGDALARKLGRKFLDMDLVFQDVHKVSIKEYVEANNWKAFREIEEKLLKDTLLAHTTDHVISTGGGVVETPGAAEFLQQCGLIVIHLRRSILDVKALLEADNNRANLGEPVESIWERRRPIYEKLSQYEFSLLAGESQWATAEAELEVFARRVLSGGVDLANFSNKSTYFLSLTYPDVAEAVSSLSNVTQGAHAIELRVDLLKTIDHDFVRQQIAHLRRHSSLPIIFTVRSATEGGQFKGSDGEYQALVGLARALAVEFIDIEAAKSHLITQVGVSKIISSQHNFNERSSRPLIRKMLSACSKVSICDIVKVVGMAGEANDSIELQDEVTRAKSTIHKPIIALLAGAPGKLSRVLNTFLTPVTHETLPFKAAPGQLTIKEIESIREAMSL